MSDEFDKHDEDLPEDPDATQFMGEQAPDEGSSESPVERTMVGPTSPPSQDPGATLDSDAIDKTLASGPPPAASVNAPGAGMPTLDGYRIVDKLGEGGMGVVWRAIQLSTNREVALKLLPPAVIGSKGAQVRFQREVESAASLEHPNIASIYDSGLNKGIFYYAMQAIDGLELHDFISERKLGQKEILELMIKCIDAVHFAHQHNIVHRDLKPGNVLVNKKDGEPQILDFGLAKDVTDVSDNLSMAGDVMGTPIYMSTEQAQGVVDDIDGRTDVYSLGVMLYEFLTGNFPYDKSGGAFEIIARKFREPPTRPRTYAPKMDMDLEAVIMKAIEPKTAERYADGAAFATDIRNFLKGRPVSARRHTTGYIFSKWMSRNKMAMAVVGLFALCAGGYYAYVQYDTAADFDKKDLEIAKQAEAVAAAESLAENANTLVSEIERETTALYSNKLQAVREALDSSNLAAANAHLSEIDTLSKSEQGIKYLSTFNEQIAGLKTDFGALQEQASVRQTQALKTANHYAELSQNRINNPGDLNTELLEELQKLHQTVQEQGLMDDVNVVAKKEQVAQQLSFLIHEEMQNEGALDQRKQRLSDLASFVSDARFKSQFEKDSSTILDELEDANANHLVQVVNRERQPVHVTHLASQETFTLKPNAERTFSFEYADVNAFTFSSVRLGENGEPDPYYLPQQFDTEPVAGGGSSIELKSFNRKKISVNFQGDPLMISFGLSKEGPWEEMAADYALEPGSYFVRFKQADYHPIIRPFTVKVEDQAQRFAMPKPSEWKMLSYMADSEKAKELAEKGEVQAALALLETIDLGTIEEVGSKEQIASFKKQLSDHPTVILGDQLDKAETQVHEFLLGFIQIQDPISVTWGKPLRVDNGSLEVPTYQLPAIANDRLALLGKTDAARYTYYSELHTYFKTFRKDEVASERVRGRELLSKFTKDGTPGIQASAQSAAIILGRASFKEGPPAILTDLKIGYAKQWEAHQQFKKGNELACSRTLNALEIFIAEGGQPNSYDLSLALYASYYLLINPVKTMLQKDLRPGNPNYEITVKRAQSSIEQLKKIVEATPLFLYEESLQRMRKNSKNPEDLSALISLVLREIQYDQPKKNAASALHDEVMQAAGRNRTQIKQQLQYAGFLL